ncbi:hypothetical protein [Vannielia sp.]|uniref:hypothetical protein n=1 Tax=Vannielia sp. TaxID=2813045 RepID=UPI00261773D8|nr:hypothetical protein [Vannielia sp.]MDF1873658.1 hypothetical protein [Vannielia sp.]
MADLPDFAPDCPRCAALCCMALAFDKGEDFALDKPAGLPCPKLAAGHLCTIYDHLEEEGFSGCAAYTCLGAGQRVTQEVFAGKSWQDAPHLAAPMAEAFRELRRVHEALELLAAAKALPLLDEDEARRQSLMAALSPEDGFTEASLAGAPLKTALKDVPGFLASLRDYL